MIRAYAIGLVVFNAKRRWYDHREWHDHCKIFHGFQKASRVRLQRALKICESQGVATKCLDNCAIARFLRDYKTTGEPDFATKVFAMLMLAENKSVAESVDIAGLMQDRDKKISVGLGAGVAV
jgi:hypothetical protein